MKTRYWPARLPEPTQRRRLFALLLSALLMIAVQVKWADGLSAAPASRVLKNRTGEEVVSIDARNTVRHLRARGSAPPRPPSPPADPDLEPGFPVQTLHGEGVYVGGPGIHTLVGEIDGDPQLEIIVSALASGPIYAWNHDGTPVPGWPIAPAGVGYPAIWEDLPLRRGVVAGYLGFPSSIGAYTGNGSPLSGWPINAANYIGSPPGLSDVDGAAPDEIFIEEQDHQFHAYRLDASILPGWPAFYIAGDQKRHTPAFADLDGDGDFEIVTVTGPANGIDYVLAYHHDGRMVSGFPVSFAGYPIAFPAIGDVDGDGQLEIVVVVPNVSVLVISASGTIERSIPLAGHLDYGTAPALADLDGDGVPEIIVETDG